MKSLLCVTYLDRDINGISFGVRRSNGYCHYCVKPQYQPVMSAAPVVLCVSVIFCVALNGYSGTHLSAACHFYVFSAGSASKLTTIRLLLHCTAVAGYCGITFILASS